jgi:hypothetical protein
LRLCQELKPRKGNEKVTVDQRKRRRRRRSVMTTELLFKIFTFLRTLAVSSRFGRAAAVQVIVHTAQLRIVIQEKVPKLLQFV